MRKWNDNNTLGRLKESDYGDNCIYKGNCRVDLVEDDYNEGEKPDGVHRGTDYDMEASSLWGLLEKILRYEVYGDTGYIPNDVEWGYWEENGYPEFFTDILVTELNDIPDDETIKDWENGKAKLYNLHISVRVAKFVDKSDTLRDEAENTTGVEIAD